MKLQPCAYTTPLKAVGTPVAVVMVAPAVVASVPAVVNVSTVVSGDSSSQKISPHSVRSRGGRPTLSRSVSATADNKPELNGLKRFSGSSTSLNQFCGNASVGRSSSGCLARSLTNLAGLSVPGNSLYCSMSSLAQSNDSITSTSSVHAERNRSAKLAFLAGSDTSIAESSSDDPFARYNLGQKRLSASRTSLASVKETNEDNTCRPSAVQGKFVSSLITKFQDKKNGDKSCPPSPDGQSGQSVSALSKGSPNGRLANGKVAVSPRDQLMCAIQNHKKNDLNSSTNQNGCNNHNANKMANHGSEKLINQNASARKKPVSGMVDILDTMKQRIQTLPAKRASICSTRESLNSSQEWD